MPKDVLGLSSDEECTEEATTSTGKSVSGKTVLRKFSAKLNTTSKAWDIAGRK